MRSEGWGHNPRRQVEGEEEHRAPSLPAQRMGHVSTQPQGSHLQAKRTGLRINRLLNAGLLASSAVRIKCWVSHPIYGILLRQPEQIKTIHF